MGATRPRHRSTRPESELASTSPTGMDFEKRELIPLGVFPPHASRHEEGSADELDITGLPGVSDEMASLKEELELAALVDTYNSLMANEQHSSDRRGYEQR